MNCPKCQNTELDANGNCPVCNPAADEGAASTVTSKDEKEAGNYSGLIEMDYSSPAEATIPETPEMPQWRQDLARRLQEIRQKRESGGSGGPVQDKANPPTGVKRYDAGATSLDSGAQVSETPHTQHKAAKTPPHLFHSQGPSASPKRRPSKPAGTGQKADDLPLFPARQTRPSPPGQTQEPSLRRVSSPPGSGAKDTQSLIDSVISRKSASDAAVIEQQSGIPIPASLPFEDRLIMLSRTLSGLVDLLIVALSTGALIIAADMASGIDIFDRKSTMIYALLLLVVFFVYSAFFLGTANQTIGMMLTDLKLVDSEEKRPRMRQILWRCFSYLASLLMLGVGLLWGCFDPRCQCLHDRISDTRVVRL
jgi:uncharacterized RDD family membrane protein YckC